MVIPDDEPPRKTGAEPITRQWPKKESIQS